MSANRRRFAGAGAVVLVAAALVAGCGGEEAVPAASPTPAQPVGKMVAGSVAQYVNCDDWKSGTREERMATIADIRGQHTPQTSTTAASPLSDERAYEMFQKTCAADWAGSLRLYKLYVKAQAFAPLMRDE
jgi:hypothetical protein